MNDLNKIDSSRFFAFWKNFSVALLVMIITLFLSMVLAVLFFSDRLAPRRSFPLYAAL